MMIAAVGSVEILIDSYHEQMSYLIDEVFRNRPS